MEVWGKNAFKNRSVGYAEMGFFEIISGKEKWFEIFHKEQTAGHLRLNTKWEPIIKVVSA